MKRGALACRECGSDELTGWSDETLYDDLDLPSPGHDWMAEEDLANRSGAQGLPGWILFTALIALVAILLLLR